MVLADGDQHGRYDLHRRRRVAYGHRWLVAAGLVGLAAVVLGGLTSYAQTVLPDALAPLANSASGWTAVTVVLVGLTRPRLVEGALLGPGTFVGLVLGYTAVSELRGFAYDPTFWVVIAVVAGPVVGTAAAALVGQRPGRAIIGSVLVAAILLADGVRRLTVLAATTTPAYWILIIVARILLLVVTATHQLRRRV